MTNAVDVPLCVGAENIDAFFRDVWQRAPAIFGANDAKRAAFLRLLPPSHLASILQSGALRHPYVAVFKDGEQVQLREYTLADSGEQPKANAGAVGRELAHGATLMLRLIERRSSRMAKLCRDFMDALRVPVSANLVLTPRGSAGIAPHYDVVDVFVLQLMGRKRWNIWGSPYPCPLSGQSQPAGVGEVIARHVASTPPLIEVTMEPGDVLYMPRGFVHSGIETTGTSLHTTISVHNCTWTKILQLTLDEALRAGDEELLARHWLGGAAAAGFRPAKDRRRADRRRGRRGDAPAKRARGRQLGVRRARRRRTAFRGVRVVIDRRQHAGPDLFGADVLPPCDARGDRGGAGDVGPSAGDIASRLSGARSMCCAAPCARSRNDPRSAAAEGSPLSRRRGRTALRDSNRWPFGLETFSTIDTHASRTSSTPAALWR